MYITAYFTNPFCHIKILLLKDQENHSSCFVIILCRAENLNKENIDFWLSRQGEAVTEDLNERAYDNKQIALFTFHLQTDMV